MPELGLYYYKARMYSPTIGRFMQTDPIGYADGMNMYAYVGNDPVNGVDPTGLFRTCWQVPSYNGQEPDDGQQGSNTVIVVSASQRCVDWDLPRLGGGGPGDGYGGGYGGGGGGRGGGGGGDAPKPKPKPKPGDCYSRDSHGRCTQRYGEDGKLELDPEYAKRACRTYNRMQKTGNVMSAGSYGFGLLGFVVKTPGPLLVMDAVAGGVTTVLSFASPPPGCNE